MKHRKILTTEDWRGAIKASPPKVCADAPPLRKFSFNVARKAVGQNADTGMEIFRFTASTEAVDRDGDVLFADGWDLDNFSKNPVILYAHDQFGTFPVGKAVAAETGDGFLSVDVDFTPRAVSENGHEVYRLVKAGFLNAVSVGFNPIEFMYNDEHKGYDFHKVELLEVSIVAVPANQEALIAAGFDRGVVKLNSTAEPTAEPEDAEGQTAPGSRIADDPASEPSTDKNEGENDMEPKEFEALLEKAFGPVVALLSSLPEKLAGVIDTKAAEAADPEVSDDEVARVLARTAADIATAADGALRDEE